MKLQHCIAGALGLILTLVPVTVAAQDKAGCKELRAACKAAGFSEDGGSSTGIKIVRDCMNPLMNGVAAPGQGTLDLPVVSAKVIAACEATKTKRGKRADVTTGVTGNATAAVKPLPEGGAQGPNIVLILVDDFSMNLMADDLGDLARVMPNLAQMRREGMTFDNYFVSNSLCCPSRATIYTGRLPHNTGVLTNTGPTGGVEAFNAKGNDKRSFGVALNAQSYATAMMGKYLNGYLAEGGGIPPGWSEWAVAGNAYSNFNYTINHNGELISPAPHMTDQLALMGSAFIEGAAEGPFFLELSTFSPHAPYTPPERYAASFMDLTYPRTPAFAARPDEHAPQWLQDIPELPRSFQRKIDDVYRMRMQSVAGVDDMIGDIRATLDELGLTEDTYVIFTGDNGYHLGEFSMRAGKMTPFDFDIQVPMIVVGPGVAAGSRVDDIAMTVDLFPTFADLAGLPTATEVDGHSLVPILMGKPGPVRNMAVVEHKRAPFAEGDPDASDPKAGDPPTYVALRMRDALYVEYLDGAGEVSYYDMTGDPHQLRDIAHTLSAERLKALHAAAVANSTCKGAAQCGAAQALTP